MCVCETLKLWYARYYKLNYLELINNKSDQIKTNRRNCTTFIIHAQDIQFIHI